MARGNLQQTIDGINSEITRRFAEVSRLGALKDFSKEGQKTFASAHEHFQNARKALELITRDVP